ncbi:2-succinylbenzoate--CoA ligase [Clostridium pasteurianum DSM 525 = ATCC 6013]|uniref:2-succinylbenzoate--CoA ligase n=2 Tax=Clostridium pasteurianum TaxID=1501 RepID=A0A0H3J9A6_CLOPA|nr:o-succinylbenzoate--CoA ligase [Clostridium pasteurianum]AJA48613.1 2-succinylbenzoate--CoA ligase [Clostridium pasteurianum DSM 525 = ATCC 6013]AJA52601.1 2-succinylbenzoate--CoA ligase [Clostridium pasteurianum DSM 525 = ATCC 6013]ELP57909.1 O-succinylbenzoic acid--CoA ligase [Clostridium pasteurianum DSM 525 = ATCC 6013]KRU11389.1 2-succinylbenzoate--CoA ligase [Clostridium pasteurianum DSM 525 = ATCC 6013]
MIRVKNSENEFDKGEKMNWLKKYSVERPDKKFINDLTFRKVYESVTDLAKKLFSYVKNEKRVALYANNSDDMALFFLALQFLNKEVLMLNTRLTDEEIKKQLKLLKVQIVFSYDNKFISFSKVYKSEKQDIKLVEEFDEESIAVIMNTSATTGEFKSVPIRWKQFYSHVKASQKSLGVTEKDNWLVALPMYHISGLSILIRSLYNGTSITILEKFHEEQVIKLIENDRINMISIVPTMLNRIVDKIGKHNLRVVLVGGEFIPKPMVEKSIAKNIPIYKTYGMTETTSQVTTFSVLDYPEKIDSVGLPLEKVTVNIENPDKKGIGEVVIKSPMLMDGYIEKKKVFNCFNSEDVGYIDEDGFLYILDRRKNIIISGGENIYPKEIENILYAHPKIQECAVVGEKDDRWGQVPILYVVSPIDRQEILAYLSSKLAKYKLPKKIIYLEELPKNASGKILKKNFT